MTLDDTQVCDESRSFTPSHFLKLYPAYFLKSLDCHPDICPNLFSVNQCCQPEHFSVLEAALAIFHSQHCCILAHSLLSITSLNCQCLANYLQFFVNSLFIYISGGIFGRTDISQYLGGYPTWELTPCLKHWLTSLTFFDLF